MKTRKLINVMFLLVFFTTSCRKEIESFVSTAERHADAGAGGLDVLGYGYDLQGSYADSEAKTRKVIDVQKMYANKPNSIDIALSNRAYFEMRSGSNMKEYNSSYTLNTGGGFGAKIFGLQLFTLTLEKKFSGSSTTSSTKAYATIDYMIQKKVITLHEDNNYTFIQQFLTADFKKDCEMLNATDLVNKYGSGVLRKIKVGGKLNTNYQSEVNSVEKKGDVEAGAKAGFKFLFNIDVNLDGSNTTGVKQNNESQIFKYETVGGASGNTIMGESTLGSGTTKININNWSSSVTNENCELIGLYDDSFIPLYKLVPNNKKAREVRKVINQDVLKKDLGNEFELVGDIFISEGAGSIDYPFYVSYLRIPGNKFLVLNIDNWDRFDNTKGDTWYRFPNGHVNEPTSHFIGKTYLTSQLTNISLKPIFNNSIGTHLHYFNRVLANGSTDYYVSTLEDRLRINSLLEFLGKSAYPEDKSDLISYDQLERESNSGNFYDNEAFPYYNRTVKLLKNNSSGKKYLNIDYKNGNSLIKVLYPLSSDLALDYYNFKRENFETISNTKGYVIRGEI